MESKSKKQKITFCSQGQWFSRQVLLQGLYGGFTLCNIIVFQRFVGEFCIHLQGEWI